MDSGNERKTFVKIQRGTGSPTFKLRTRTLGSSRGGVRVGSKGTCPDQTRRRGWGECVRVDPYGKGRHATRDVWYAKHRHQTRETSLTLQEGKREGL